VVVLGASPKPSRYSNQAVKLLRSMGYRVTPVHPKAERIEGLAVAHSLGEIPDPVHTLTLYVGPQRMARLTDAVIALRPGRVIVNPGAEWSELERRLDDAAIPWLHACTLVLLRTHSF
jgi:hypothetical protein